MWSPPVPHVREATPRRVRGRQWCPAASSAPRLLAERLDGSVEGREEMGRVEVPDQLVALELAADRVLQLREDERGPLGVQLLIELVEHVRRRRVDVGDRLGGQDDPAGPGLRACQAPHLVAERPRVREEQRRVESQDHETRQLLGIRIELAVVVTRHAGHSPERRPVGPPRPPEDIEDRERDSDRDSLEHPEQRHAAEGRHGKPEFGAPLTPQAPCAGNVGQRERRSDDDRGKRRLRKAAQKPRHEDEHQHDRARADKPGQLGLGARLLGDRRARAARADRKALKQRRADVGGADPDHFPVSVDLLAGPGSECRRSRDGVGERHERDSEGPGYKQRKVADRARPLGRGKSRRESPDEAHPVVTKAQRAGGPNGDDYGDEDSGDSGPPRLEGEDEREADEPQGRGGRDGLAGCQAIDELARFVNEPVRIDRKAEKLRQLSDEDREGEAVHVADLGRLREQVGNEAELCDPGQDRDRSDQQREHRGECDRPLRAAARPEDGKDGCRDHRPERGVRPEDENPRGAERRVADQAENRGVEARDRRQARELRVGHPLRDQQSREDEPGGDILAQPGTTIGRERSSTRESRPWLHGCVHEVTGADDIPRSAPLLAPMPLALR